MSASAPGPVELALRADDGATFGEHVHAVLLALACAVLFLRGALWPGQAMVPFDPTLLDVQQAEALAAGSLAAAKVQSGSVVMGDKYFQSLCWDRVLHTRLARGEVPSWTRDIGCGAPFVPQMAQPYHPSSWLLRWLPAESFHAWTVLLHLVAFGFGAYAFLRAIGCAHAGAAFGLVVACLGTWTQSKLHHNVILSAAVPAWPMLWAAYRLTWSPSPTRSPDVVAALLALATGLSWGSGFAIVSLQATQLCLAFGGLGLIVGQAPSRGRAAARLAVGLALGLAVASANWVPILCAYAESARRFAFDESLLSANALESEHLLAAFWPDLLAWPVDRIWGAEVGDAWFTRQPWSQLLWLERAVSEHDGSAFHSWVETAFSPGTVATVCAVAACWVAKRRALVGFFAVVCGLAFGLASAAEPCVSIARWVPGMLAGDLRRHTFLMFVALVVLAGLGADALGKGRVRPFQVLALAVAAISTWGLFWSWQHRDPTSFVDGLASLLANDAQHPLSRVVGRDATAIAAAVRAAAAAGEAELNQAALWSTAVRALVVSLLAAGIVSSRALRPRVALSLLAALELLHVGGEVVRSVPAAEVARVPKALAPVHAAAAANGERSRLARLMPASSRPEAGLPGNFPGYLGIEDTSFYSALAPQRAAEWFRAIEPDRAGKVSVAHRTAGIGAFHDPASLDHALCDLLGIRFVLSRVPLPPSAQCVERTPRGCGSYHLYERTTTLPRATFVTAVDVVPERAARLALLADPERDVRRRVVLEQPVPPLPDPGFAGPADVRVTECADERVCIELDVGTVGYLRLADPWDRGWRAQVDDDEVEVLVADHWLRAVRVPAGRHRVVFTYDGPTVVWPLRVSLLASACTLLWLFLACWRSTRRRFASS